MDMSRQLTIKSAIFFPICILLQIILCGCDDVPDAVWQKSIPGTYQGEQPGFRETLELNLGGTFRHQVLLDERPSLSETGKWAFDVRSGAIHLEPFTSFWNNS